MKYGQVVRRLSSYVPLTIPPNFHKAKICLFLESSPICQLFHGRTSLHRLVIHFNNHLRVNISCRAITKYIGNFFFKVIAYKKLMFYDAW